MSYLTQSVIAHDPDMVNRVAQAAASEGVQGDPDAWTFTHRRTWAAAPGWGEAWDSAVAGDIPDPGADPGVITDAQVQAMLAPDAS